MTGPRPLLIGMGDPADQPGGLNRHLLALHTALRRAGVPARSLVVAPPAAPLAGLVRVSRRPAPLLVRVVAAARAARVLADGSDVVDVHFPLYGWWPVTRGALRRTPLVAHLQGDWAAESASNAVGSRAGRAVKAWLQRDLTRRAAAVVVLSPSVAEQAVADLGVHPRRVHVVPPGVDAARFRPGPAERGALGLPDGPLVLTVRRLVPRTGVDVAVRAAALLPDVHLAVVGDGPERPRLEQLAARLGVAVTFAGAVPDEDLPRWYRSADLTVVPSVAHEGWGLVVDESLACGTPVVASRLGGLPAALPDDALVPPGDPAALAARVRAALDGSRPLPAPGPPRPWSDVAAATAAVYARAARPRLVVVDHCARPAGAELALAVLAPHLAAAVDLTVVLGEEGPVADRLRAAGLVVEVLPAPRGGDRARVPLGTAAGAAAWSLRLAALLRRVRADVVHANTLRAGLLTAPAARLAGVPMVWSARDRLAADYLPGRVARLARGTAEAAAAAVVANSPSTLATWAPRRPLARVVPSPGTVRSPVARAGGPFTVGTLSRLAEWKGQDLVVEAFAQAFPTGDERLRIAGAAWFGEEGYAAALQRRAADLGVATRVDLVGHRDDVAAELAGVDVVVAYARTPEPFGQVVVEALTAGRAVVAAAEGGPADTLTDGVDGLLVPPRDPVALAAVLRRLRDDVALRDALAAAGRRTAERYRAERVADEVLAVYREVLSCRRA